jgi:ATP-dependent helicase STH1/SNF2
MEKQADGELAAKEDAKEDANATRRAATPNSSAESITKSGSELTDWTFRKLMSCSRRILDHHASGLRDLYGEAIPRAQYPEYYNEIVKDTIAINDILQKCRAKIYTALQEFRDDWQLLFPNARTFNGLGFLD